MRILLTGASGQLGAYLRPTLVPTGWGVLALGGPGGREFPAIDLSDAPSIPGVLDRLDPDAILHAAAISSAERVRLDPIGAWAINVEATRILAEWCELRGRRIVFTSTDLVFPGVRPWNREDDPAEPVLAYGRTKREAETSVLATPRGLVARLSLLYGPSRSGRESFFDRTIAALRRGETQSAFEDEFRTPLDLATAADLLVRLVESPAVGLIHVGGSERMSRFDLLRRVAIGLGLNPDLVIANRQSDMKFPEPRPADVSLDTSRMAAIFPDLERPTIEDAMKTMCRE